MRTIYNKYNHTFCCVDTEGNFYPSKSSVVEAVQEAIKCLFIDLSISSQIYKAKHADKESRIVRIY